MYYEGASNQKTISASLITFQTVNVMMELESPTGSPKVFENAKYYVGGWRQFGDGQTITSMELLPNDYSFKVFYDGISDKKSQNVASNSRVDFYVSEPINNDVIKKPFVIDNSVSIYPNPFSEYINISFELLDETHDSVRVFDLNNKLVTTLSADNLDKGKHNIMWYGTIDSGNLAANGVYIIQIKTPGFESSKKVMLKGE